MGAETMAFYLEAMDFPCLFNLEGPMFISKRLIKLIEDQEGWTRWIVEEGIRIKKEYGEDKVYDFSLGNPIQSHLTRSRRQ
jgi:hypothetical protein